jgi:transcriptional regulator with XRE-family HTH domain
MVGARLRRLRLHHNLRQEDAAEAIAGSIAKISRMEHGLLPFRREDLHVLLNLYGVTDPYQQETLISVALGHRDPGWWDHEDVPLAETAILGHEQVADLIRTYQPLLVPELLRTEEYARAAHQVGYYTPPSATATQTWVENLMRRQQALRAGGCRLWVVIEEPVLWRPLDRDMEAHARQLDALAAASQAQCVTIQINPVGTPYLPAAEPFTIFRSPGKPQILALHRYTGDEISELQVREHYGLLFDQIITTAGSRRETPQIIARARDHLDHLRNTTTEKERCPS